MTPQFRRRILYIGLSVAALILSIRYLLPVLLPFLLGGALALLAEPLVSLLTGRCRMPRAVATGISVTGSIFVLFGLLSLLGALAVRGLTNLAGALPDLQEMALQGILYLRDFFIGLTQQAPEKLQPQLTQSVLRLFGGSGAVLDQAIGHLPGMAGNFLSSIPNSALTLGTGILAAFMISARLPALRTFLRDRVYGSWEPVVRQIRRSLLCWLRAQAMLALITFGILTLGFLLLRFPHPLLLGVLIAIVDAVPLLGTGTVLIPWSLILLLRGQFSTGLSLLILYATAAVTRAILEPRFVGKQLGLDPLVTLFALYVGFRLWGILGMILAPMAGAAIKEILIARSDPAILDKYPKTS